MPLLKQETDVFPTDLFDLSEADLPWRVAHVRSRQEKVLARRLLGLRVAFYLPQRIHRVRRSGRTFVSHPPLFPGYVFFRGSSSDRMAALASGVVVRILEVPEQTTFQAELSQVHRLQRSGASLVPCSPIAPGDAVRIVDGPFQGYTGTVVRGSERPRLIVSISMLRKSIAVEFDRGVLSPMPSASALTDPRTAA